MKKSHPSTAGTMLATAVAIAFFATPVLAQSSAGSMGNQAQVKCMGGNSCKGQSACKTATSPGPGQNSCKGHGFVMSSSAKDCAEKGGHVEASHM